MGIYVKTLEIALLTVFSIAFTMSFINVIGEAVIVELNRDRK